MHDLREFARSRETRSFGNARPPRSWPVALRWSPPVAVAALLAACGGGAGGPAADPPLAKGTTAGVVIPAQAGLVVVETDSLGRELQRSSDTDAQGRFTFTRPTSGARFEAVAGASIVEAPAVLSARAAGSLDTLQITPLTTVVDQAMRAGTPKDQAAQLAVSLLSDACGATAGKDAGGALFADSAGAPAASSEWLLTTMDGYAAALRRIGSTPLEDAGAWVAQLQQNASLLGRMCTVAQQIYAGDWAATTLAAVNAALPAAGAKSAADIASARASILRRILTTVGNEILPIHFPVESTALDIRADTWTGREAELATSLAVADAVGSASAGSPAARAAAAGNAPPLAADLTRLYSRQGDLVESLSASVGGAGATTPGVVRIGNRSGHDVTVDLFINGHRLKSTADVVAEVLSMPPKSAIEPLQQRAWRYFTTMSSHAWALSVGLWMHQPDLYLRSMGMGLCDDSASALHWTWQAMGMSARVDALNGHVIPEVFAGGRWQMYDVDYGVYYLNRNRQVAGVTELQADPTLVSSPTAPILPLDAPAYWPAIAAIYGDVSAPNVNVPYPWYSTPFPSTLAGDVTIPSGGYVEVDSGVDYPMPSYDNGGSNLYAKLRLWLPPGFSGTLALPGVLGDIRGSGQVTMLGASTPVTASGVQPQILAYYASGADDAVGRITVDRVDAGGMTLTMLSNPRLYDTTDGRLRVVVRAASLAGVTMSAPTGAPVN